jgi:low temperature requirement protein LtrA
MSNNLHIWWDIPKKFTRRERERKITWLELFNDLVYAGIIAQLTEHLSGEPGWEGLCRFVFFFLFVFWAWTNGAEYHDLHGNEGVRTRYMTLLEILGAAAVAICLREVYQGQHQGFALSFAFLQLIITYRWISVGYYDPTHWKLSKYYRYGYILAFVLLVASAFTDMHTAFILWGIVLPVNFLPNILSYWPISKNGDEKLIILTTDSLVERFGLFTIIVLGENIFGVIRGIAQHEEKSIAVWIMFVLAMLISFCLWWIYFDILADRRVKPGYVKYLAFYYLYIPLLASFAIVGSLYAAFLPATPPPMGVGAIGATLIQQVHSNARLIFAIAVAIILLSIVALNRINQAEEDTIWVIKPNLGLLVTAAALIAITGYFNTTFDNLEFLGIIVICLLTIAINMTICWVKMISAQKPGG